MNKLMLRSLWSKQKKHVKPIKWTSYFFNLHDPKPVKTSSMNGKSHVRTGKTGSASRKGVSGPGQPESRIQDYEYFQLYDPEDSDIAEEADPDVRNLLSRD